MRFSGATPFLIAVPVALVSAAVVGQPAAAPAAEDPALAASSGAAGDAVLEAGPAAPTITFESLGLSDGIAFNELDGRSDLHFRVPVGNWFAGARLVLPYQASAARPTPRTLTIMSGNRLLGQLPVSDGAGRIEIPIPLSTIVGGDLAVSLVYSGGLTPDRCADARMAADRLLIVPSGGLELDPAPGSIPPIAASIATMGMAPTILVPPSLTPEQAAAVLTVIAARGDSMLAADTDRKLGVIRIGGANEPAVRSLGPAQLAIGGSDPAGAARAILGGAAYFPDTAAIDRMSFKESERSDLTFADLGASTATVSVNRGHAWTVELPASRIPGGQSIRGVSVNVASVAGAPDDRISAWLNGTMLGSSAIDSSGITRLRVTARGELTNAMNSLTVRIDRPAQGDCGDAQLAMPAQLLDSSKVEIGTVEAIEDFHNFASASSGGFTVVLPDAASLPLAARAVAGLINVRVPIKVSFGAIPADGPVMYVRSQPPPGTTSLLQLANGRMVLAASESGVQFDLPQTPTDTIVQLLNNGGRPLLWIRPAPSGVVPATLWLNQGNIAIVNPAGTVQALSTNRSRLAAPTEVEPQSWWDRNAWKIFLAAGLLLGTGLVGWALRPSIKRALPGQSE